MITAGEIVPCSPAGVSRLWNAYARVYDMGVSRLAPYREMRSALLACVEEEVARLRSVTPDHPIRILDLCCGTGNLLVPMLRTVPGVKATGIDGSSAMLAHARRKCVGRAKVRWLCGNALDVLVSLPDGSFDIVLFANAFYPQPQKPELLAELRRTLAPNGTLVLTDPKRGANLLRLFADHLRSEGAVGAYILPFLIASTVFSLIVQGNANRTFFDAARTRELLGRAGLSVRHESETYAGANYLLVAGPGGFPSSQLQRTRRPDGFPPGNG